MLDNAGELLHRLESLMARAESTTFKNEREVCLAKYAELLKKISISKDIKDVDLNALRNEDISIVKLRNLFKSQFDFDVPQGHVPFVKLKYYKHIIYSLELKLKDFEDFNLVDTAKRTYNAILYTKTLLKEECDSMPDLFRLYKFLMVEEDELKYLWEHNLFKHNWHNICISAPGVWPLSFRNASYEETIEKCFADLKLIKNEFENRIDAGREDFFIKSYFDSQKLPNYNAHKTVQDGSDIINIVVSKVKKERKKKKKQQGWNYLQEKNIEAVKHALKPALG